MSDLSQTGPMQPPISDHPQSLEEATQVFTLYRQYIQHEDANISNRMTWFIQLQSFLFASYAVVTGSLIQASAVLKFGDARFTLALIISAIFQMLIATTGVILAKHSDAFIDAGVSAVYWSRLTGQKVLQRWIDAAIFPGLTNGRVDTDEINLSTNHRSNKASMLKAFPKFIKLLWTLSSIIPALITATAIISFVGPILRMFEAK